MGLSISEKDIRDTIYEYLVRKGHFPIRDKQVTGKNQKMMFPESVGNPDIMCLVKGKPIHFIEVKKPSGTIGIHQMKFLEKARQYGAVAFVATCLEDVMEKGL